MHTDTSGSYLREPSVSEGELKARIEALAADIPLNHHTVIERNLSLSTEIADINLTRAKKELEASLGHQVTDHMKVTMRYNPTWKTFDVSQLEFALPGTSSLIAKADFDPESDSYASYLYDKVSELQIGRKPIQTSTINALLQNDTIISSVTATTQSELLIELFQTTSVDMQLTIHHTATLLEEELSDDVSGVCSVERTQEYGQDDILDVIRFVNQIYLPESTYARIVSVLSSQHGSLITAEEASQNSLTGESTKPRGIELDYETLEKLIANVSKAHANIN